MTRRPGPIAAAVIAGLALIVTGLAVDAEPSPDAGAVRHVEHVDERDASTELLPSLALERKPSTSTSTTTTTVTSTTSPSARTAPTPPAASAPSGDKSGGGAHGDVVARVRSTSYCLTGRMANGEHTHVGAVAANRWPIGTRLTAWPNPWGDPAMVFTVKDRHQRADAHGYPTELDFAMPSECQRALAWGNETFVDVRLVN